MCLCRTIEKSSPPQEKVGEVEEAEARRAVQYRHSRANLPMERTRARRKIEDDQLGEVALPLLEEIKGLLRRKPTSGSRLGDEVVVRAMA